MQIYSDSELIFLNRVNDIAFCWRNFVAKLIFLNLLCGVDPHFWLFGRKYLKNYRKAIYLHFSNYRQNYWYQYKISIVNVLLYHAPWGKTTSLDFEMPHVNIGVGDQNTFLLVNICITRAIAICITSVCLFWRLKSRVSWSSFWSPSVIIHNLIIECDICKYIDTNEYPNIFI